MAEVKKYVNFSNSPVPQEEMFALVDWLPFSPKWGLSRAWEALTNELHLSVLL